MTYPPVRASEPPLDWPHYGIGFLAAIKRAYKKYATFSGRASRSEYWFFALYTGLVHLVVGIVSVASTAGVSQGGSAATAVDAAGSLASIPFLLFFLATIVPSLAVGSRRLHDAGFSGALLLLNFVPYLGSFVVTILTIMPTSANAHRYGPSAPLYPTNPGYADPNYGQRNSYPHSYPAQTADAQPSQPEWPRQNAYGQSAYGQNAYGQDPSWLESPWQNPDRPASPGQDPR